MRLGLRNVQSVFSVVIWVCFCVVGFAQENGLTLQVEQITSGKKHHLFGYIGQCQTIPWCGAGRYILAMEIDEIGRMPEPHEAATICLIDTKDQNRILRIEKTRAWNPQQGTMFFWNPSSAATQFFFNDRDVDSGDVFTVLYDIETPCAGVPVYRYTDWQCWRCSGWFGLVGPELRAFSATAIGDGLSRESRLVKGRERTG